MIPNIDLNKPGALNVLGEEAFELRKAVYETLIAETNQCGKYQVAVNIVLSQLTVFAAHYPEHKQWIEDRANEAAQAFILVVGISKAGNGLLKQEPDGKIHVDLSFVKSL